MMTTSVPAVSVTSKVESPAGTETKSTYSPASTPIAVASGASETEKSTASPTSTALTNAAQASPSSPIPRMTEHGVSASLPGVAIGVPAGVAPVGCPA